jgi:ribosomal protein L7/L12
MNIHNVIQVFEGLLLGTLPDGLAVPMGNMFAEIRDAYYLQDEQATLQRTEIDNLTEQLEEARENWAACQQAAEDMREELNRQAENNQYGERHPSDYRRMADLCKAILHYEGVSGINHPMVDKFLQDLNDEGNPIKAIKFIRCLTDWGLKESKDYFDKLINHRVVTDDMPF